MRVTMIGHGQEPDSPYAAVIPRFIIQSCQAEVCTIGSGEQVTIADLHALILRKVGTGLPPQFDAPRAGEVKHSLADVSRVKSLVVYEPRVSLEAGLTQTVKCFRTVEAMAT